MTARREHTAATGARPALRGEATEFFARANAPFLIVSADLEVREANRAADELMGLGAGDRLLDGFWSVSGTAVMRLVEGVRRDVDVSSVSARTVRDRLVDVDAFLIDGNGEELVGLMVTDRSSVDEAQRRLKEQEERYRSLFEWAPVAMREQDFTAVEAWLEELRAAGVTDLAPYLDQHPDEVRRAIVSIRTTRVNAAAVELLKAPSTLAVLQGFRDHELTTEVLDSFKSQFVSMWERVAEHEADFVGMDYSGSPFECRLRAIVPSTSRGRDMSRVVAIMLDLTELRATTRRLERLVADKNRFIASVSHELRTPLAAVFGISEELVANWEHFEAEELRELVGMVAAQSAELAAIVEDLLVAANLESGKVAINAEKVSLNALAGAAVADCRRSAPELDVPPIAGPETSALADAIRVRQIVRNLLTNAIRYGGDRIWIRVGADVRPSSDGVRPYLEVVDNGDGIPLEHRASIFDPYYQAAGKENVLGSLGLGLSISRELARCMGGELTYAYEGGHSVFRVELPGS